ncbi:MAG: AraC family transcriptional regulator [Bacteroidia bacterium]|nr:helix-turn-helix domain-containing protein [Bacteroidota bacterium]
MNTLKPTLEKISPAFGSSFAIKKYNKACNNKLPFWHFHPEMEIVYVKGGSGKRHIGNHLSYFHNGDLIFIGSDLPHYGFTDRLTGNESEIVIQMRKDFLGDQFFDVPEMAAIRQLFERAKLGISFYGITKDQIGNRLERFAELDHFERLMELLAVFREMAVSKDYKILNAGGIGLEVKQQDNDRINVVYRYVRKHFHRPISLEEIAAEINMTVPAFCRYFKKLSGKTFTRFVNEFRVVHACKLLSEKPSSITEICYESGFNNFSHFNKIFKETTGKSPSAYRTELTRMVS